MTTKSQNLAGSSASPAEEMRSPQIGYDCFPLSVVLVDPEVVEYVEVDQSLCNRLQCSARELIHHSLVQTHPELGPAVVKELCRQLQVRSTMKFYTKQKISSGETLDAFVTASLVMRNGRVLVQLVTVDVTARLRAERALQEAEKRFRGTFEQFAVGIAHVALNGTYLRVNRKYRQILGYSEQELHHLTLVNISHPNDIDADWAQTNALLEGEISTYSVEKRFIRKGRSVVWVNLTVSLVRSDSGDADYFISVIEDITARRRAESERDELLRNLEQQVSQRTAELERLSLTDALTGIPNRRHLDKALAAEWARSVRSKRPLSLVLIDIDDFKILNDSFGHVQGDGVIKAVASAVQQVASRSSDLGARYGGDEFAMLLPETEAVGAQRLAERLKHILNSFSFTDPVHAGQLKVTVSQGIAGAAGSSEKSATDLLLAADRAMYVAKKQGRGHISTVSDL
jgi:diguanylate cyclase (GGDEF)-like protein/PAS domain S-box-containing protein